MHPHQNGVISYANIANGGTTQAALKALTNGTVNNYQGWSSINANKQAIFDALDNNKVVTLATFSNSYDKKRLSEHGRRPRLHRDRIRLAHQQRDRTQPVG